MDKKFEYRSKIALYFILLGIITFTILFLTAPRPKHGPQLRVLKISYSGQSMITTEIKSSQNVAVINLAELKLSSEFQLFYKNNLVLECTSDFPVTWDYEGYGIPPVEVHNTREIGNINDLTTFSYTSSLNLMPISEISSGKYTCLGLSSEDLDDSRVAFVQLFVPGPKVFVLEQDLNVESDLSEELFIPCQVSDPFANISLLLKGEIVDEKFIKDFHPDKGFVLTAKFMEEKDPFSTFICQDLNTKVKSGKVTVSLKKNSLVLVHPVGETVHFSNQFNGTFSCKAKENVTLKFKKIQRFKRVDYALNLSSEFGFQASVTFEENDLKEGSVITCLTQASPLHAWTISMSKSSEEIQSTKFFYKDESDEYVCCGTSINRPKLRKLSCSHPIECKIQHNCFSLENIPGESKSCMDVKTPPRFSQGGSACIHHKVEYKQENEDMISTGAMKCGSGSNTEIFNFVNVKSGNDTILIQNFGSNLDPTNIPENISDFLLGVEALDVKSTGPKINHKYACKAPKFFFAAGFIWQIDKNNGALNNFIGQDHIDGSWIYSEFEDHSADLRQANKIYCIAPVWNSDRNFVYKFTNINIPKNINSSYK